MKQRGDKRRVTRTIVEAAVAAWPGTVERYDLDREPAIAAADGRTIHGQIRSLAASGVIAVVDQDLPDGRVTRLRATAPAAEAIRAVAA